MSRPAHGRPWGGYDKHGFLDVFLATGGTGTSFIPNHLYHNNGDGTFSAALTGSLVNDKKK